MFSSISRLALLLVLIIGGGGPVAGAQTDDVWSEGGLRVADKSLRLELSDQRLARVQLRATPVEFTFEASTLVVLGANPSGMVVKSMGPGTVTASDGRRMNADSLEVWLSNDGWGYFKAIRRVVRR